MAHDSKLFGSLVGICNIALIKELFETKAIVPSYFLLELKLLASSSNSKVPSFP